MQFSIDIPNIIIEPFNNILINSNNLSLNNNTFKIIPHGTFGEIFVKIPRYEEKNQEKYEYGQENHLWAHTRHKNIIPFLGVYIQNIPTHKYCTVLEFMMGCSLQEIINNNEKYTPAQVYNWMYQGSQGLDYLHSGSIAHLDIKPANLMVDPTRKILKICDFDSATKMELGEPIYLSNGYTPYFLDSYVWDDPPSDIPRVKAMDIYSLAVTTWVLFQKPARNISSDDSYCIQKISRDKPRKIIDYKKITDRLTADFIKRMWGIPQERPTAAEVRIFMEQKKNQFTRRNSHS